MGDYRAPRFLPLGALASEDPRAARLAAELGREPRAVVLRPLPADVVRRPGALARWRAEARRQAGVAPPHLLRLLDVAPLDDGWYRVEEHVDGVTLAELREGARARGKAVPPLVVARLVADASVGLEALLPVPDELAAQAFDVEPAIGARPGAGARAAGSNEAEHGAEDSVAAAGGPSAVEAAEAEAITVATAADRSAVEGAAAGASADAPVATAAGASTIESAAGETSSADALATAAGVSTVAPVGPAAMAATVSALDASGAAESAAGVSSVEATGSAAAGPPPELDLAPAILVGFDGLARFVPSAAGWPAALPADAVRSLGAVLRDSLSEADVAVAGSAPEALRSLAERATASPDTLDLPGLRSALLRCLAGGALAGPGYVKHLLVDLVPLDSPPRVAARRLRASLETLATSDDDPPATDGAVATGAGAVSPRASAPTDAATSARALPDPSPGATVPAPPVLASSGPPAAAATPPAVAPTAPPPVRGGSLPPLGGTAPPPVPPAPPPPADGTVPVPVEVIRWPTRRSAGGARRALEPEAAGEAPFAATAAQPPGETLPGPLRAAPPVPRSAAPDAVAGTPGPLVPASPSLPAGGHHGEDAAPITSPWPGSLPGAPVRGAPAPSAAMDRPGPAHGHAVEAPALPPRARPGPWPIVAAALAGAFLTLAVVHFADRPASGPVPAVPAPAAEGSTAEGAAPAAPLVRTPAAAEKTSAAPAAARPASRPATGAAAQAKAPDTRAPAPAKRPPSTRSRPAPVREATRPAAPATGFATIEVRAPAGSAVEIDGIARGVAPFPTPLRIEEGSHFIRVTKGRGVYDTNVSARAGEDYTLDVDFVGDL